MKSEMHDDFFLPQLSISAAPKVLFRRIVKRVFDFVFSLLLVLLLFPWLFPLIALLIVFDSEGGVLFIQKRVGLHNRVFNCIKFRTMIVNDEADTLPAGDDDSRITRIGKWLRLYGLDELPQLLNVLAGDMSLVGPRPHMYSDNLRFEQIVDNYRHRHRIRPGITGLAQVQGYKGNFTHSREIEMRIALDLVYTDTYSFMLDLKIIIRTIKVTFFKVNQERRLEADVDQALPDQDRFDLFEKNY